MPKDFRYGALTKVTAAVMSKSGFITTPRATVVREAITGCRSLYRGISLVIAHFDLDDWEAVAFLKEVNAAG
jgi:hypothetical protein